MKKKIETMLAKLEARKTTLATKSEASTEVAELRSISADLDVVNGEIAELRSILVEMPSDDGLETRGVKDPVKLNALGTYGVQEEKKNARDVGKYDSVEYRNAFMDYVVSGKSDGLVEFRTDATASTTDISAIIPNTILNKVIEKMNYYGQIWARVTKTTYKGGVQIPISALKPTATWVTEGSLSDKQSMSIAGKVTFSYHKLQCRVAVSIEADAVSLPLFEQTITNNIYEAIVIALETSIISGTGTGQPLGIVNDTRIGSSQKIAITDTTAKKFETWVNVQGKIPLAYEGTSALIMTKTDWNKYIVGMTDAEGEPIERVQFTADGLPIRRLLGMEVILVDSYLPVLTAASTGDTFGIIVNLAEYYVNSNMQMTFKRYFWEETDEWISKATLIADGKMGDVNGVLLLQKG